jgi:SAM-dependent methyltransferase
MTKPIQEVVQEKYRAIAASGRSNDTAGARAVAEAFGYTPEELASIPAEANMGLSCGNPTATANLRPGEVVVDLGSGGGLDVFLAARKVGPTGKAVGIDMTPEMIDRARAGARKQGLTNVEFHRSTIDRIPLPDASADVVISNCVINLAPDKPAVLREVYRVLKPGGRVAISDIALKKSLPPDLANDLSAYVGCIAGAVLIPEYVVGLKAAGFSAVEVVDAKKDLGCYQQAEGQSGCCAPSVANDDGCCGPTGCGTGPADSAETSGGLGTLLAEYDVNEFAASVLVYAIKPAVSGCAE